MPSRREVSAFLGILRGGMAAGWKSGRTGQKHQGKRGCVELLDSTVGNPESF